MFFHMFFVCLPDGACSCTRMHEKPSPAHWRDWAAAWEAPPLETWLKQPGCEILHHQKDGSNAMNDRINTKRMVETL